MEIHAVFFKGKPWDLLSNLLLRNIFLEMYFVVRYKYHYFKGSNHQTSNQCCSAQVLFTNWALQVIGGYCIYQKSFDVESWIIRLYIGYQKYGNWIGNCFRSEAERERLESELRFVQLRLKDNQSEIVVALANLKSSLGHLRERYLVAKGGQMPESGRGGDGKEQEQMDGAITVS